MVAYCIIKMFPDECTNVFVRRGGEIAIGVSGEGGGGRGGLVDLAYVCIPQSYQ